MGTSFRRLRPGLRFGVRLYELNGIRFARAFATVNDSGGPGYDFFEVGHPDYRRFYRAALRRKKAATPPDPPPVLPADQLEVLRRNTVDYLVRVNLQRIKRYGGRPKRGVLLAGPPGNGKTSACRWVWQQCVKRGLSHRFVTADEYRGARGRPDAVKQLFHFDKPGVVFFDDLDMAVRDRDQEPGSEFQSVFLTALDGIESADGVVFIFTTNCPLDRLDPTFKRPRRIDVILQFPNPSAGLRRELIGRWHPEILAAIPPERIVGDTEGKSFAELDEPRNLLVMRFTNTGSWEWDWERRQFTSRPTASDRAKRPDRSASRPKGLRRPSTPISPRSARPADARSRSHLRAIFTPVS